MPSGLWVLHLKLEPKMCATNLWQMFLSARRSLFGPNAKNLITNSNSRAPDHRAHFGVLKHGLGRYSA